METNTRFFNLLKLVIIISLGIGLTGCGSDNSDDPLDPALTGYALFVDGALALEIGSTTSYQALFISVLGEETNPSVEWTVENLLGTEQIATISNTGILSADQTGAVLVTATYDFEGVTYQASLPIDIYSPSAFVVSPGAIIGSIGEKIDLTAIYLNTLSETFNVSYSSNNSGVASVSNSGEVSLVSHGNAVITVSASIAGNPVQEVPVLVVGEVDIPLEVAKVEISPKSANFFPGESLQFSATVYDSEGNEVEGKEISWKVEGLEKDDNGNLISVGAMGTDGTFSAEVFGPGQVTATVEGISSVASVYVVPEFVVVIDPFSVSIAPGSSKSFTASVHEMDKETLLLNETPIANPPSISWELLDFGIDIFNIGTVSQDGEVTIKEDALPGLFSLLMAYPTQNLSNYAPGFSLVDVAIASECECGEKNADAVSISVNLEDLNLSLFGTSTAEIHAEVLDQEGTAIDGAITSFCSNNEQVVTVDDTGFVIATGLTGEAVITVCHGDLSKEIPVTVAL